MSTGNDDRRLRVFLVDDHPLFRAGVRAELSGAVDVVGEADEIDAAIELIRERDPDIVLLDVHLPSGGGEQVVREVRKTHPDIKFLALSVSADRQDVLMTVHAGASGYVTKTTETPELLEAIRRVAEGDAYFSRGLAATVIEYFQDVDIDDVDPQLARLTPRELDVVREIARGFTYGETAERLFISQKTVESHMTSVLRKLQLTRRHQLTEWAHSRGIN